MRSLVFVVAASLLGTVAVASDSAPGKVGKSDGDKMICKREVPTGSLIPRRKTCYTVTQWQKLSEDAQREYERMNPHLTTEHGN